jgi:hypothetical protein
MADEVLRLECTAKKGARISVAKSRQHLAEARQASTPQP